MSGSVISAKSDATAISADCTQGRQVCYFSSISMTISDQSTYYMTMHVAPKVTNFVNCTLSSGSAICTGSVTAEDGAAVSTSSTFPKSEVTLSPIVITAGIDKLPSVTTTKDSASASSTSSSDGGSASSTEGNSSESTAATASSSESGSAAQPSQSNAAGRMAPLTMWGFVGAAVSSLFVQQR